MKIKRCGEKIDQWKSCFTVEQYLPNHVLYYSYIQSLVTFDNIRSIDRDLISGQWKLWIAPEEDSNSH